MNVEAKNGRLHANGKALIGHVMARKGALFIEAGRSLADSRGDNAVTQHLICQGFECLFKGFLLLKDYDKHKPLLAGRKKGYGHDLVKLLNATAQEFGTGPLAHDQHLQLVVLNDWYSQHLLRYGSLADVLMEPPGIGEDLRRSLFEMAKRIGEVTLVISTSEEQR